MNFCQIAILCKQLLLLPQKCNVSENKGEIFSAVTGINGKRVVKKIIFCKMWPSNMKKFEVPSFCKEVYRVKDLKMGSLLN